MPQPVNWVYHAKGNDPGDFTFVTIDDWNMPIPTADFVALPRTFKHLLFVWKHIEQGQDFAQLEEYLQGVSPYRSPPEHDIDYRIFLDNFTFTMYDLVE